MQTGWGIGKSFLDNPWISSAPHIERREANAAANATFWCNAYFVERRICRKPSAGQLRRAICCEEERERWESPASIRQLKMYSRSLGASVWTNDGAERNQLINHLEAGMVFVNRMVASDPRLPFGGIKWSGYGREPGVHGIREFTDIKTVWIQ
jgi:hypothetical protein